MLSMYYEGNQYNAGSWEVHQCCDLWAY